MPEQTLSKPIFGLDIGSYSIKAAEVKFHGNEAELVAASIVDLPEPEKSLTKKNRQALVGSIKKAVELSKPHRIDTVYVASALPESKVYTDIITLPHLEAEELKTAVPFEAAKHMPLAPKETYIDFSIIEITKNKKLEILVVGASRELVDFYRSIIGAAGLELIHLEIKPIAAARALLNEEMKRQAILILDVGANNSSITIFLEGNIVVATTVFSGGESYVQAVAKELKIDRNKALSMTDMAAKSEDVKNKILRVLFPLFDDLVAKIQKAIAFYATKKPRKPTIDKIIMTGGGSITPGFQEYIKQNVGIETTIANPFINLRGEVVQKIPQAEACSIVTAIGLALKR
ncbi:MAG: type IV pilus assembly protein PilM [Candidatus Berkelbacteria bacterium]|nr:type IV pilus assembly protein PilM [Candidatus Berkelbacteria bacterium]